MSGEGQDRIARFDGFDRSPKEPQIPTEALDRVLEALVRSRKYLPAAATEKLAALWDVDTFAAFVFLLCLWAGVQFTPIGWLADLALLGYGVYGIGGDIKALIDAGSLAKDAKDETQIDQAARAMAAALSDASIDAVAAIIGGALFSRLRKALRPVRGRLFPRLAGVVGGVALERGAAEGARQKKKLERKAMDLALGVGGLALLTVGVVVAVSDSEGDEALEP